MSGQETVRPDIAEVLAILERRAIAFAARDLGMPLVTSERQVKDVERLRLRDVTALITVGPGLDLHIAFSFSAELIRRITRRFIADLALPPEDEASYVQESAREVVNIVVGNSTAELARTGETLHLSPPAVLIGAREIPRRHDAIFAVASLAFEAGDLDIACLGPQRLFDPALQYLS